MRWAARQISDTWIEYQLLSDDIEVHFLNYGGIITKIIVPDQTGKMENIVLGYDNLEDYTSDSHFLGALIGRVGGRIPNAHFQQHHQTVQLTPNEGANHLHGGPDGFHQVLWETNVFRDANQLGVKLTHTSHADENGYPGTLDMTITYALQADGTFSITYDAIADTDTLLSPTNHTYFNLSGDSKQTVHQHIVTANCGEVLEVDRELLPTGTLLPVQDTPFDFRKGKALGAGIHGTHPQNMMVGNGYDHYCLFQKNKEQTVHVKELESERELTIQTTQPGFVLYTANSMEEGLPFSGGPSMPYQGVCFETQAHPASLEIDELETVRLKANTPYQHRTTYQFH